ncbi:major facilitator superfamily domain-containing protein [Fennellomyces sp. T-0311]|nr:major facilitator superfamily domain-containing protein [Fennellomyces sp. T-0311]
MSNHQRNFSIIGEHHSDDSSSCISTVVASDYGKRSNRSDTSKEEFVTAIHTVDSNENQNITLSLEEEKKERQLVRKFDLHVIPLFCIFYFMDHLDRQNISNAALAGLQEDLGMTGPEFSVTISAFYITYIIFQVPSNIILKRIGARWWLSSIMLVWGLVTTSMALTTNFTGLLITRLLLGAAESGYIPGILYQLSRIYKPQELGFRIAILLFMAALAGIVSGPIGYVATGMGGKLGLYGWQYLFIFEGAPTVLLALLSFWVLFDNVNDVRWLTQEQKELQERRMMPHTMVTSQESVTWCTMRTVLSDKKTWLFSALFFLVSINVTSIGVFLPIIINGFNFSAQMSQLLTAPPAGLAGLLMLVCGLLADHGNRRAIMVATGSCAIALGYTLLLVFKDRWPCYAALFIIAAGVGIEAPIGITWSAINYHDLTVRAVAVAVVNMMGNLGNVVASFLYTVPGDTSHVLGNGINLVIAITGALIAAGTGLMLRRRNRRLGITSHISEKDETEQQFRYFY